MYFITVYIGAMSQSLQGITAHIQIQQQTMGNTDSKQCTFCMPCVYKLCILYSTKLWREKTVAELELQENWRRKLWRLAEAKPIHY